MVINIYIFKNSFCSFFLFFKKNNMRKGTQNMGKIITLSKRSNGSIKQCYYILIQFKNDIRESNMVFTSKMTFKYVI